MEWDCAESCFCQIPKSSYEHIDLEQRALEYRIPTDMKFLCNNDENLFVHRVHLFNLSYEFWAFTTHSPDPYFVRWEEELSVAEQVIRFAYKNECHLTEHNLLPIIQIANKFKMVTLLNHLVSQMDNFLNMEHGLLCFKCSKWLQCDGLIKRSTLFVLQNFLPLNTLQPLHLALSPEELMGKTMR